MNKQKVIVGKTYLAMTRVALSEAPCEPYGKIIGAYMNRQSAEDAMRNYYISIAKDAVGGSVEWIDDFNVIIRTASGEKTTYVGSILKLPVWKFIED